MYQLANAVQAFPVNKKTHNLKNYHTFNQWILQNWLDKTFNIDPVEISKRDLRSNIDYDEVIKHADRLDRSGYINSFYNHDSMCLVFIPDKTKIIQDTPWDFIASTVTSNDSKISHIGIIETKPEDYNRIAPQHVVDSYKREFDNFEEIVILEPIETTILDLSKIPMIDDPILVGKFWDDPDHYFILDFRYEDEKAHSFAKNIIESTKNYMPNMQENII